MKIISHRGFWIKNSEKNTISAFERSFELGLGTETDLRDFDGQLVISHDIATKDSLSLSKFFKLYSQYPNYKLMPLALNIKADGLAYKLNDELSKFKELDFFVFDMSIPDMKSYFEFDIPVFTRISEVELNPIWLDKSHGIWLDSFEKNWFDKIFLSELLSLDKRVCIVSSELHSRNQIQQWELIYEFRNAENLILCTDFPQLALEYFKLK